MADVILPALGEGIEKATVSYWYFKQGEAVKEGQDIVELATDKATFNLPSPHSGKLSKIFFKEGDSVGVGAVIASIEG